MPRKRRRGRIPTPAWERQHGTIGRTLLGRTPQFYATVGIILLVVAALGVVAYAVASDRIAEANRPNETALKVGDKEYTLEYYTDRLKDLVQQLGGVQQVQAQTAIAGMTQQLLQEAIVLRFAADEGQSATDDDVNGEIATRLGITKDDANFQTRFQEELARSGLKEDKYRDMASAAVLRKKLLDKFTSEVPASAESVHYRQILVGSQTEADAVRTQIEGGADFAALAQEKSTDTATKSKGGDAGWVPRGVLAKAVEDQLFGQEVNKITTYPVQSGVYVYQVLEKAADRAVEDTQKSTLAQRKLQDWMTEKQKSVTVEDTLSSDTDQLSYVRDHVGFVQ